MNAYHVSLVHFPIALWITAMLVILWRTLSDGALARTIDRALVPLLTLALLAGLAAFLVGTQVWAWETLTSSPLGRNHMLMASWTVALWAVLLWLRWRGGEAVWQGPSRWVMALVALLGSALVVVTATLGGHLMGATTGLSRLLVALGWEVYQTYYVPSFAVWALLAIAGLLVLLGWWARGGADAVRAGGR